MMIIGNDRVLLVDRSRLMFKMASVERKQRDGVDLLNRTRGTEPSVIFDKIDLYIPAITIVLSCYMTLNITSISHSLKHCHSGRKNVTRK